MGPQRSPRMPDPVARRELANLSDPRLQIRHLDDLARKQVALVDISKEEVDSKEAFRNELESIANKCGITITLAGFGSLASGFGMPGSDMDLAIVPASQHAPGSEEAKQEEHYIEKRLPRRFEKALLEQGIGARLLTKTRVPILKICQKPTPSL